MLLLLPFALAGTLEVDATRSVVLTNSETLAMGGAGVAAAVGADGAFYNPAAAANRAAGDTDRFFWSSSFGLMSVGPANPVDLGNVGTADGWSGGMLNLGIAAGWRAVGLAGVRSTLTYYQDYVGADGATRLEVDVDENHIDLAGALLDERLVVGLGARLLHFDASAYDQRASYNGVGLEAGAVLSDPRTDLELGLVWRQGTTAGYADGPLQVDIDQVHLPTQVSAGLAWHGALRPHQLVPLPLRAAADLVYSGAVPEGVALEPLMLQLAVSKGQQATLSPRLGAELEAWPDRLRLRGGTYLEPTRTELAPSRWHGTGGLEVRLFHLKLLKGLIDQDISYEASFDVAARYVNVSYLGIGTWQRR